MLQTQVFTHEAIIDKEDKKIPMTKEMADGLRDILKGSSSMAYITIPNPKDPFSDPIWEGRAGSVRIGVREYRQDVS